jgi:hypothetical protein
MFILQFSLIKTKFTPELSSQRLKYLILDRAGVNLVLNEFKASSDVLFIIILSLLFLNKN